MATNFKRRGDLWAESQFSFFPRYVVKFMLFKVTQLYHACTLPFLCRQQSTSTILSDSAKSSPFSTRLGHRSLANLITIIEKALLLHSGPLQLQQNIETSLHFSVIEFLV